ncbi:MAG: metal-dependent phosphohydrolase [Bacteroidetes bacterium]|nr:MAG: metal-dependent phosphohydrolase [Bacteroidota bacterium]
MSVPPALEAAWATFAAQEVPPVVGAVAWTNLCTRYGEAHRHYHTYQHLIDLLDLAAARPWRDAGRVQAVIWWHDVIYDPWQRDNEARSAAEAAAALQSWGWPAERRQWVETVIRATARHEPLTGDPDELAFLDMDLAVLARPAEAYDAYAAAIRREYRHVPGSLYRRGRRQVLEAFLQRPHIYFTARARAEWEDAARANLARELNQ